MELSNEVNTGQTKSIQLPSLGADDVPCMISFRQECNAIVTRICASAWVSAMLHTEVAADPRNPLPVNDFYADDAVRPECLNATFALLPT